MKRPWKILLGPTASGKESLALRLADALRAEIISVDSMKIYRGMDIGTATPSADDRRGVRHWCLDLVDPGETFSVARYVAAAEDAVAGAEARGCDYLFSGGTALYYKGLTEGLFDAPGADEAIRAELNAWAARGGGGALHAELSRLDPDAAGKIHPNDIRRLVRALEVIRSTGQPISAQQTQFGRFRSDREIRMAGLLWDREILYDRINRRVDRMLAAGLVEEAERLYARTPPVSKQARAAVGYAELFDHFAGRYQLDEAVEQIKQNTRRLAKSQMTWFRKFDCAWIRMSPERSPEDAAREILAAWGST